LSRALTRPRGAAPYYTREIRPALRTPALYLVKEEYIAVTAEKMVISLPRQIFSSRLRCFGRFRCSALLSSIVYRVTERVHVPSVLHVIARFRRCSWSALVISPYPERSLRFPRLARSRPFWPFSVVRAGDCTVSQATKRVRSTFSPFSTTYTFSADGVCLHDIRPIPPRFSFYHLSTIPPCLSVYQPSPNPTFHVFARLGHFFAFWLFKPPLVVNCSRSVTRSYGPSRGGCTFQHLSWCYMTGSVLDLTLPSATNG
jgi:hypothetical protein